MYIPNGITDFLCNTASSCPDKISIVSSDKKITWHEIYRKSDELAGCFISMGLRREDRVVVCLDNCIETIIIFWAIVKMKAVVSIVHPSTPLMRLNWILQDSTASLLLMRDAQQIVRCWQRKENELHMTHPGSPGLSLDEMLLNHSGYVLPDQKAVDLDLASIIYTSGSTGISKGVMLTQHNMFAAACSITKYLQLTRQDIIISALPLSFDYGLYQMILSTVVGATLILEKDFTWPIHFLKKLSDAKATVFPAVATQLSILINHCSRLTSQFESIRMITNTGTTLFDKHIAFIQQYFPRAQIYSMYGLTECKRCTYLPPDQLQIKKDSVGIAIPNTEIWIEDEEGRKLSPFEVGQLVVRGSTVMRGYWNNPIDTEKVLRDGKFPGEKVLYTGDYGYLDHDGYFYFRGRRDDVIKRYSEKVSLNAVEDSIRMIATVNEVVVLNFPNEMTGADIVAFVVFNQSDQSVDVIDLHCKKNLSRSHWPSVIHVLSELPRSLNGKYDRQALKYFHEKTLVVGAA